MTRDETLKKVIETQCDTLVLELPTSFGKTKMAMEWLKHNKCENILIVIPRLVLIQTWKDEITKHKFTFKNVDFVTYKSLGKKTDKSYDAVVYDEAHHLSDRCLDIVPNLHTGKSVLLSATLKKKIGDVFEVFHDVKTISVSSKKAMDSNTLPTPKIMLVPLTLDSNETETIVKNPKQKEELHINFKDRFKYKKVKNRKIVIHCSQIQKHQELCREIEYYKIRNYKTFMRNLWLHKCGERLKWLASLKTNAIKDFISNHPKERMLVFCADINQTEQLDCPVVNSKNTSSDENLDKFNEGKLNHIACVDMLNEGINVVNCRIGVFVMINSSEKLQIQKTGRLLRHENPVIIIPYFKNTREEEIVSKMMENYDKDDIIVGGLAL